MVEVDVAGLEKDSKDSTLMFGVESACTSCEAGYQHVVARWGWTIS